MEDMSVFKSYLRRLLQDLKNALREKDYSRAEELVETLITDTEHGLQD